MRKVLACTTLAGASALLLSGACSVSTAKKAPIAPVTTPAAGSTGAFGIVTVSGKQKMYLPAQAVNEAGHPFIAVVDVGVAGNGVQGAPALITNIDLATDSDTQDYATTTGGDSSMVIAASTENPTIWFIDPTSDTIVGKTRLDPSYGTSSFSGGGGFVTGIAMDSAHGRAILSVWNGFAILDLASKSIKSVIQAPPSENFGFDSIHQWILAPFYQCSGALDSSGASPTFCGDYKAPDGTAMTDGLNVIDLSDDTVYTYQDASAPDPSAPVGSEPDSAAADPTTGMVVVPSEGDEFQSFIDLSKAKFDKTNKWVTAPRAVLEDNGMEGVAVESDTHLVFWEQEFGSTIAVGNSAAYTASATADGGVTPHADAGAPAVGDAAVSVYATANMPLLPGDGFDVGWANVGDPHGIAVTTGISDSRAVGFVVSDDYHWVARIDLAKFLSLPSVGNEVADVSPAVTYLDATTKP